MISEPEYTVAFTGHRTYNGAADDALRVEVGELYGRGFRKFLSGMAVGFDMAGAEAVLACRASNPDLQLVCVVPFVGQDSRYSIVDRERYGRILAAADETIVLAPGYKPYSYTQRNNFLTDHAALLVAWYDGSAGGTDYTVRRALCRGLELVNLCPLAPSGLQSDPVLF